MNASHTRALMTSWVISPQLVYVCVDPGSVGLVAPSDRGRSAGGEGTGSTRGRRLDVSPTSLKGPHGVTVLEFW